MESWVRVASMLRVAVSGSSTATPYPAPAKKLIGGCGAAAPATVESCRGVSGRIASPSWATYAGTLRRRGSAAPASEARAPATATPADTACASASGWLAGSRWSLALWRASIRRCPSIAATRAFPALRCSANIAAGAADTAGAVAPAGGAVAGSLSRSVLATVSIR
jgi:hypothetical protein